MNFEIFNIFYFRIVVLIAIMMIKKYCNIMFRISKFIGFSSIN